MDEVRPKGPVFYIPPLLPLLPLLPPLFLRCHFFPVDLWVYGSVIAAPLTLVVYQPRTTRYVQGTLGGGESLGFLETKTNTVGWGGRFDTRAILQRARSSIVIQPYYLEVRDAVPRGCDAIQTLIGSPS